MYFREQYISLTLCDNLWNSEEKVVVKYLVNRALVKPRSY
jgi:hypothetical protein